MESIIQELSSNYKLDNYSVKADKIVFEISNIKKVISCPYCGVDAHRIHSYYQREIQDLPIQNKKTILLVTTRKFFCDNKQCNKKTFSEQHTFVESNRKKTKRLEKNILFTSAQLSSINASKILKTNRIDVSKSTICEMLKKNATDCG